MRNKGMKTDHRHAELVFGLVYGVGTEPDKIVRTLEDYLKQFDYMPRLFRISDYLRSLDLGIEFDDESPVELMHALMNAGDEARRRTQSDNILAVSAANDILDKRTLDEHGEPVASFNVAQIVRSMKRPEEVALLRTLYRPGFFLIGIASDDDEQELFLTNRRGLTKEEALGVIERDRDDQKIHGQRTRDTFYLSDVFLELRESKYESQLKRFLELVFGRPFITPTKEENAMFMAYASAARSSQLGRQVGAAIATPDGAVIGVGFNEVPSRYARAYCEEDSDDHRDHKVGKDSNYESRKKITESIVRGLDGKILDKLNAEQIIMATLQHIGTPQPELAHHANAILDELEQQKVTTNPAEVRQLIDGSDLRDVTEFGRAVHAEMDAIMTCARLGIATKGKHLYTTTFPCHNCTRHIIAAGISKVIYIEPYPKSKAEALHSDAICFDENEAKESGKIPFVPFVGVGPRRYLDLFSSQLTTGIAPELKDRDGKPIQWKRQSHRGPKVPMEPYSYLEREQKALDENKAKLALLTKSEES